MTFQAYKRLIAQDHIWTYNFTL